MSDPNFDLDVTDKRVSVRLNALPTERFCALILFTAIGALGICAFLFLPGKHGDPSMWHDLSLSRFDSKEFMLPFLFLLCFPFIMGFLLRRYITSAYPSDETFQCDGKTLTISRVRWLDIRNKHWNIRSYALSDVENIRYQVVASARGTSIYGLSFIAEGRTERVLPGLDAQEGDKVLKGLKALGADVPDDPALSEKLAEADASYVVSLNIDRHDSLP